MDITYKITFYNDWHCGSGLAAGADLDALVIKDANGLPFVPGKTIKGLVREAVEYVVCFEKKGTINDDIRNLLADSFGNAADSSYNFLSEKNTEMRKGRMFFTNAEVNKSIRQSIIENELSKYMYRSISSTAIEDGVAKNHTLRRMETVIPCELEGRILSVPNEMEEIIKKGLKYIKRIGQNRNRGLGRCEITVHE